MYIIGDLHGLKTEYSMILDRLPKAEIQSIALGEIGFKKNHKWFKESEYSKTNKILFGNHDYIPDINQPYSLGRWTYLPEYKIFAVSGAKSLDKWNRTEGVSWFRDEELNVKECDECLKAYEEIKPQYVISHDCPMLVSERLFHYHNLIKTTTGTLLDEMFKIHKPEKWIFGHHHKSNRRNISGTEFVALKELEIFKL